MTGRFARRTTLALALGVVMCLSAGPVAAGGPYATPPDADTGNQGVHVLVDDEDYAGARCKYVLDTTLGVAPLTKIRVRPPIVYAFDRTGGLDRQQVMWRYRIWTSPNSTTDPWTLLAKGPAQKRMASDRNNAAFRGQTYAVPSGHVTEQFFVQVLVRWLEPNSLAAEGRALMGVKHYENDTPWGPYKSGDSCVGAQT